MANALQSLIRSGTKVWLDSVDPDELKKNVAWGATGATSNPIIIADLIGTGRFDEDLTDLMDQGIEDDQELAWAMTDKFVGEAQDELIDIWERTGGDDGYVSFELDPLLEDAEQAPPHEERVRRYIELAKKWGHGHENRMIKVPATKAGLEALEDIAALGTTINVTLLFTRRQYEAAREAIWRGRQRYGSLDTFKSVYSIFISRVDVYTAEHLKDLSDEAQGMVGLLNAKRLWKLNAEFWQDKNLPLKQEFIFASTSAKLDWQEEDYYVRQLAGSDIQTNPPKTNAALAELDKDYPSTIDQMPSDAVQQEIDEKVDVATMEDVLMEEGTRKFADPFKKLLDQIAEKRKQLTA